MKRIFATFLLALPLATVWVLPKTASAQPVIHVSNDHQAVTTQQYHRDYKDNRNPVTIRQNNRSDVRVRDSRFIQQHSRHHRKWVAAHYEKVSHHRRWVPGHYEYR
jgi:hypothetical protein